MRLLLVNTNTVRPPIAPVGLDYLADAVAAAGHETRVLDLGLGGATAEEALREFEPHAVGVTVRNTDDCYFAGQDFFLPRVKEITDRLRTATDAPVIVGGVGFSVAPEATLEFLGLDWGVAVEGEFGFPELLSRLSAGSAPENVPGLVWRQGERFRRNPRVYGDLGRLPHPSRAWLDLRRYFREGGQIGFETKRGCDQGCIYCADPLAKGPRVRLHSPERVVSEVRALLSQGVDHLHTCDSEFNLPEGHARAVCRALVEAKLGGRVRWYAYCAPKPFSTGLAESMAEAGCGGIDFGADHCDEGILAGLGRQHRAEDLERAAEACRAAGLPFMFDLLLGGPGENPDTLRRAIDFAKRVNPTRVGLSIGLRVYPGTNLAGLANRDPGALRPRRSGALDLLRPTFFLAPALGDEIFGLVGELVGDDPRFLFADPAKREQNYNYNANRVLEDAIAAGERGAYWDILRRIADRQ